ncbi:MAG: sigma-70 family RNA polymerase sigma factor [Clostridia bacterium]|nr:sigma-70 family RNA polymerase sigma factor [Clostridia bacterium]
MQPMEEIYQQYAQTVFRYLYYKTRSEDIAEELTQETFYQAVKNIDRFDGSCKISTWLCAIAKNQLLVYYRKHPPQEDVETLPLTEGSAESSALENMGKMELLKKLHGFPEPYREIIYLRAFGGLSFKEIGEIMGKSENWARVTFYRGKEKLAKENEQND